MGWLQGEPTLEDVLSDPTVHALMKRDDVDPDDFRTFLEDVRRALEGQVDRQPASDSMPRSLHTQEPSCTCERFPRDARAHARASSAREEGYGRRHVSTIPRRERRLVAGNSPLRNQQDPR